MTRVELVHGGGPTLPRKMVMDNLVNEMRGNLILATFRF